MNKEAVRFIEANKTSPVVEGAWLDSEFQDITKNSDYTYLQYRLEDGQVFNLTTKDAHYLNSRGFMPDWGL